MTRRELFSLLPAAFAGVHYRDYSRCLPDYLAALAAHSAAVRDNALSRLVSPSSIAARQAWVRRTFWQLAGGRPSETPLNARIASSVARDGYRLDKVVFESRPNFHVPALVYVPANAQAPLPAVLFQAGHDATGKGGPSYQRCCQALARLGFLVLAFDPMGQGERVYCPGDVPSRSRLGTPDDEHNVAGRQMLLAGDTATRMQVWDAVRALDCLAAHPLADATRIGAMGQSGGGTLTMMLLAADSRVAAAAVIDGNTENLAGAHLLGSGSTDDAEQNFVGAGPLGFDRWDLLYPCAPRPLLIGVSAHDWFGTYSPRYLDSGREEFARLQAVYGLLGARDRIEWTESALPHSLAYDSRMAVYKWFRRWLQDIREPLAAEPQVEPEAERAVWVTNSGSVVRDLHGETPRSLTHPVPAVSAMPLAELLRLERPPQDAHVTVVSHVPARGLTIEAIEVQSAPGVFLPAWLFLPEHPDPSRPLLLAAEAEGRNLRWREDDLYQSMARQGSIVCAADLRGIGDLEPSFASGNPRYSRWHASEDEFAWASLTLGRPLAGQRAADLMALVAALAAYPATRGRGIRLAASARLTVPALFAAALEPRIAGLYLASPPLSFRDVFESEEYSSPFANFVPGILCHTDLPEIAAQLAPRPVVLAGVRDSGGDPVTVEQVRRHYQSPNVEVRSKAVWDAAALIG